MKLHAGKFRVSLEMLASLLQLPEGAEIVGMTSLEVNVPSFITKTAVVVVQSPDLPEWAEGAEPADLNPSWTQDEDGNVEFNDWGVIDA